MLEEHPVADFGERLAARADAALARNIESHHIGGYLLVDVLEQDLNLVVAEPVPDQFCGAGVLNVGVGQCYTQHFGKAGLTRAEKPGGPHPDGLVGLIEGFVVFLEDFGEVAPDRCGRDVFLDLLLDHPLVGLVDLDDLLDVAADIVCKELAYFHADWLPKKSLGGNLRPAP